MPIVERDLANFVLATSPVPKAGSKITSFSIKSSDKTHYIKDCTWTLDFPLPNAYRTLLEAPDRPRPPHDNVLMKVEPLEFEVSSIDTKACTAVFQLPLSGSSNYSGLTSERVEVRLSWKWKIYISIWDVSGKKEEAVLRDVPIRAYGLTEHGIKRHWFFDEERLHLGLGEKAGPIDLSKRSFTLHASDSAQYDAYNTDPLYKHHPFLISVPKPDKSGKQGLSYALFHASNSIAIWDVGREIDMPSGGLYMSFTQDWGGMEEWVLIGKGVQNIVQTMSQIAGKPKLVGRDWLGYLASTMLLADLENAQKELEKWPAQCKEYDIPCSAMHLSSGFTASEKDGNRYVFYMNKKRYPDFKGMVGKYHKSGMKLVPNVKPYVLKTHPSYKRLLEGDGLFHDPFTNGPATQNIWSNKEGSSSDGSWVDLSAKASRDWWCEGVEGLVKLGVDGMWDDNSEYYTRDDEILFKNEFEYHRAVESKGATRTGLMGRITGNELMNRYSDMALTKCNPERRTYILTRSGNFAAFKYACSTWSGDNATSWHNMRGSQHIQLNSGMSLMQSYGSDVGGFVGDIPTLELFVRWVQLGATHSRFCIHSAPSDRKGNPKLNTPWMYPEVLPIIRDVIKTRYLLLPYFNGLMWESHIEGNPTNAPLFYGPFSTDPVLYTEKMINGFSAWCGVGRILTAPALFEGQLTQDVYFPKSSPDDKSLYFDWNAPHGKHVAGTWATVGTPLEHGGMFVREGAVIPVGKDYATVTATSGSPRTHVDGVDVVLESEGGVVGVDDWRGVLLFPGTEGKTYIGSWTEDDGISSDPEKLVIEVSYTGTEDEVKVSVTAEQLGFNPLWKGTLHVILPTGDQRKVVGTKGGRLWGERTKDLKKTNWRGRSAYLVELW